MSADHGRNSHQKRRLKEKLFGGRRCAPCCFCRRELTMSSSTLEHVIPLSHGGGWDKENLRLSCGSCNNERGNEDFAKFRDKKRGKNLVAEVKNVL